MTTIETNNNNDLEEPLLPVLQIQSQSQDGSAEYPREEPIDDDNNDNDNNDNDHVVLLVDGMPWKTSSLLKTLYFLEALGASAWGRFGAIYYNLHGLNRQQIGLLEGLMPCIRTVSKPLWGVVSDTFHCRKVVYVLTNTMSTTILLLLAIPTIYSSYARILCVSLSVMVFSTSGILDTYTLDLLGGGSNNKNNNTNTNTQQKKNNHNQQLKYGRYRMWASISWGMGSIVMGIVTDRYGTFRPNFIIYATLGTLSTLLVAWRIPSSSTSSTSGGTTNADKQRPQDQQQQHDESSLQLLAPQQQQATDGQRPQQQHDLLELLRLVLRPRVVFFLLEVIVIGIGMGTVERLLFLYLVNDLHASTLLCGLSVGVNVLLELPIFWNAKSFTTALGHDGMMIVSMICFCIRVYCYTLLSTSTRWYVLPLEVMHGITFACFYVTATNVAKDLIGQCPGWNTTIPLAVQTLYDAVGAGVGSIGGGWAMQRYGSRSMYRTMAYIMTLLLFVHVVATIVSFRLSAQGLLPNYSYCRGQASDDDSCDDDDNDNENGNENDEEYMNECDGSIADEAEESCLSLSSK